MLVRAGASNREMAVAMGVNIRRLFTAVFARRRRAVRPGRRDARRRSSRCRSAWARTS